MNPLLLVDSYKVNHFQMYPEGMTLLYSNLTPRKSRIEGINEVVVFGIQHFILEYLIKRFNEEFFCKYEHTLYDEDDRQQFKKDMLAEYARHAGAGIDLKHIEALWDLGYLPIEIKALPEGTRCPIGVPMLTIRNTHPDFAWLTNYLETLMSCMLWQPMTSATIAYEYKKLLSKYAIETTGTDEFVIWQGHDFSMRGMSSVESAILSGMGHLTSFTGTDTIPAIYALETSYNATRLIGASVPATEHSVMCMGKKESELETIRRLLKLYPNGILSIVCDTWDLWHVITNILPQLKDEILARDGKLVIRPDSGDPVDIICGKIGNSFKSIEEIGYFLSEFFCEDEGIRSYFTYDNQVYSVEKDRLQEVMEEYGREHMFEFSKRTTISDLVMGGRYSYITREKISIEESKGVIELLWDVFGGTTNELGYKVLDSHIGAIYGDSITLDRAKSICERLKAKSFASTNIVLGIGSYTYQYNTRDTFGFAVKATYGEITTKEYPGGHTNCRQHSNGVDWIEEREIFKDPITDDGTKKSKKGLLRVYNEASGIGAGQQRFDGSDKLVVQDQCSWNQEDSGLLTTAFLNGKLVRETTLDEIRSKLTI